MVPILLRLSRAAMLLQLNSLLLPTSHRFAPPRKAQAATLTSVCQELDAAASDRRRPDDAHRFDVSVGAPGMDSWCSVSVRVTSADGSPVQYVWLKDATSSTSRRIFGAKKVPPDGGTAELTKLLKEGARARPMLYCNKNGLYEGEPFDVRGPIADPSSARAPPSARSAIATAARRSDPSRLHMSVDGLIPAEDTLLWTMGLVLAAYASGYASEGYEPHKL